MQDNVFKIVRKRKFFQGPKRTVSIRLPKALYSELSALAENLGYGFSAFVQDGLDQWASLHQKDKKK